MFCGPMFIISELIEDYYFCLIFDMQHYGRGNMIVKNALGYLLVLDKHG